MTLGFALSAKAQSIGDSILVVFTAPASEDASAEFLKPETLPTEIMVLDTEERVTEKGKTLVLRLLLLAEGEVTVPWLWKSENGIDSIKEVIQILPSTLSQIEQPLPDAPAMSNPAPKEPINWNQIVLWAGIALLALLAIVWLLLRSRKEREPNRIKPGALAQQRLKALEKSAAMSSENSKIFYVELTEILREYIDGVFGLQTRERTSSETASMLEETFLSQNQIDSCTQILSRADQIKFAKGETSSLQRETDFDQVELFVNQTWAAHLAQEQRKEGSEDA